MLYSGKNGLSQSSYNPFLPTRGTLTDPIAHAQQRQRQKVPNDRRTDPTAWEPKKVPRELQKILPDEAYDKEHKKYHPVDTIARLPDLCIFQILSIAKTILSKLHLVPFLSVELPCLRCNTEHHNKSRNAMAQLQHMRISSR